MKPYQGLSSSLIETMKGVCIMPLYWFIILIRQLVFNSPKHVQYGKMYFKIKTEVYRSQANFTIMSEGFNFKVLFCFFDGTNTVF